jgi:hypothetical protein
MMTSTGHHLIEREIRRRRSTQSALFDKVREVRCHIGRIEVQEVGVGILIRAVVKFDILLCGVSSEPSPFDLAHVSDQTEERQRRWFNRSRLELLGGKSFAFHQQRGAMKVNPFVQRRLLFAESIRLDSWWAVGGPGRDH